MTRWGLLLVCLLVASCGIKGPPRPPTVAGQVSKPGELPVRPDAGCCLDATR